MDKEEHNSQKNPLEAIVGDGRSTKSMKRKLQFGIGLVVALVLVLGVILTISNRKPSQTGSKIARAEVAPTAQVTITANGFSPATIKIKKGQMVTWTNQDSNSHQIASEPYPQENGLAELNADAPLAKGASYSFTFEKAGTYNYLDHLNPLKLKGTVIVE